MYAVVGREPGLAGKYVVEFRFRAVNAKNVYLLAPFNGWTIGAHPLAKLPDGSWSIKVPLSEGVYPYRFSLNGEVEIVDRDNPHTAVVDGKECSLALVGDPKRAARMWRELGEVSRELILHDPRGGDVSFTGREAILKLRVLAGEFKEVEVVPLAEGGGPYAMERVFAERGFEYFEVEVPESVVFSYCFRLRKERRAGAAMYYSASGVSWGMPGAPFRAFPSSQAQGPGWAAGTVFYEADVEEFAEGAAEKLKYVRVVGASALCISPFLRSSGDGYDVSDFYALREPLTADSLSAIVKAAHDEGLKVIADFPLCFVSTEFKPFRDVLENQEHSPYKDWFIINAFPVSEGPPLSARVLMKLLPKGLRSGLGEIASPGYERVRERPRLNMLNGAVREHVMRAAVNWVAKLDLDGLRLVGPLAAPPEVVAEFVRRVKSVKPDAFICAWWDLSPRYVGLWSLDALTNYEVRSAVLDFVVRGVSEAQEVGRTLMRMRALVPAAALISMYNSLSARGEGDLYRICHGDSARIKLALSMLFCMPGSPAILSGDEVPSPRRKVAAWPTKLSELTVFVSRLARLKRANKALRLGRPRVMHARGDLLAVKVGRGAQAVIAAFNRSRSDMNVILPCEGGVFRDVMSGEAVVSSSGSVEFSVPGRSCAILVPVTGR